MQALRAIIIVFLLAAVNYDAARACCTPDKVTCAADCLLPSGCAACPALPPDAEARVNPLSPPKAVRLHVAMVAGETLTPDPPPPRGVAHTSTIGISKGQFT